METLFGTPWISLVQVVEHKSSSTIHVHQKCGCVPISSTWSMGALGAKQINARQQIHLGCQNGRSRRSPTEVRTQWNKGALYLQQRVPRSIICGQVPLRKTGVRWPMAKIASFTLGRRHFFDVESSFPSSGTLWSKFQLTLSRSKLIQTCSRTTTSTRYIKTSRNTAISCKRRWNKKPYPPYMGSELRFTRACVLREQFLSLGWTYFTSQSRQLLVFNRARLQKCPMKWSLTRAQEFVFQQVDGRFSKNK